MAIDGEAGEAAVVALPVEEVGVGDGAGFEVGLGGIDGQKFARMRQVDGVQQHRVDDGEECRVDTDAQSQRDDDDSSKAWRLAQLAECEAEILQQVFEPRQRPALPDRLLGLFQTAKLDERPSARFLRGHAGAEVVVDVQLKMAFQLGGDVILRRMSGKQAAEAMEESSEGPHL